MIIDGKMLAKSRLEDLKTRVLKLKGKPKLVAVLVGNDPASEMYVSMKAKRASEIGVAFEVVRDLKLIQKLNQDENVTGIIVQLPLPKEIDTEKILQSINPKKDVDGLTGKSKFLPATVKAVLIAAGDLKNKTVVVVGLGKLVGKPLADYLAKNHFSVVKCDEFTKDLKTETLKGDVLVSATGVPGLVKPDMVKPGAIVIDCGAPKPEVDPSVFDVASFMTPVPGGIGPLTVASLLENTVDAYEQNRT